MNSDAGSSTFYLKRHNTLRESVKGPLLNRENQHGTKRVKKSTLREKVMSSPTRRVKSDAFFESLEFQDVKDKRQGDPIERKIRKT